jgi:hypothetical protein
MKTYRIALLCLLLGALLSGCASENAAPVQAEQSAAASEPETISESIPSVESVPAEESITSKEETAEMKDTIQLLIGETEVPVTWEDNASVEALKALRPLTIQMSMYGGFEQVGAIGQNLPRDDSQTTTKAGDIVLYSGNQIVVFYGSNSWAYTRLGHITDKSAQQMADLLGRGDVTITIEGE